MRKFFVVLLLFGAFSSITAMHNITPVAKKQVLAITHTVSVVQETSTPTPDPSPSPSSVPSPKATETPVGFCLHVPILMYHHVQPLDIAKSEGHAQMTVDSSIFDKQMAYLLSSGYTFIFAEDIVHALRTHQQLPAKSIAITLDDGYDDAYNYAYPIAKKYNIKMGFMIPTGLIENAGYMSWNQLKEVVQNPLIHLYNHTWSHASLGGADRAKIESEITTAQSQLKEKVGVTNAVFVYPYGSFSPLAIQLLQEHGYTAALTTIQGTLQCESTIMELQRIRIGNASLSRYGL